jgi:hypothetical protein
MAIKLKSRAELKPYRRKVFKKATGERLDSHHDGMLQAID